MAAPQRLRLLTSLRHSIHMRTAELQGPAPPRAVAGGDAETDRPLRCRPEVEHAAWQLVGLSAELRDDSMAELAGNY
jgi:hypothetical protein